MNLIESYYYKILKKNLSNTSFEQSDFVESDQISIPCNQRKLNDNRKCQYFTKLGIDKNQNYALKYLSTGIAQQCDLFIDLSLIQFIADFYHNAQIYSLLTQILCCFPNHSKIVNSFFLKFFLVQI
jgi:hypothetical protein